MTYVCADAAGNFATWQSTQCASPFYMTCQAAYYLSLSSPATMLTYGYATTADFDTYLQENSPAAYKSDNPKRSASYRSANMLRDMKNRHVRSQYHPEERYVLPPTVQSDIGWGLTPEMYKASCAKFQEGAEWHGRTGSHITKFSERLLLGARHHQSGPMTKPALHY